MPHLLTYAHHRKVLGEVLWPAGARRFAPSVIASVPADDAAARQGRR